MGQDRSDGPESWPRLWNVGHLTTTSELFLGTLEILPRDTLSYSRKIKTVDGELKIMDPMNGCWDAMYTSDDGKVSQRLIPAVVELRPDPDPAGGIFVMARYMDTAPADLADHIARFLYEDLLPVIKKIWPEVRLPNGDKPRLVSARPGPETWLEDVWAWVEVNKRKRPRETVYAEWDKLVADNRERGPLTDARRSFYAAVDPNKYGSKVRLSGD